MLPVGVTEVWTGDREFDHRFDVHARDPEQAKQTLSERRRRLICQWSNSGRVVALNERGLSFELPLEDDLPISELMDDACDMAEAFEAPREPRQRAYR